MFHRAFTPKVEGRNLLTIRLSRVGAKKRPHYRIVVIEKDAARDGRYLEVLGTYYPLANPAEIKLNRERYDHWLRRGAQPSDTVKSFLKRQAAA
ncbi:MAG: 30S ribosomal protein S16 [Acidobacteriia bacterium]|nr:30S ribosomal protein S16 [Terriglobia bacterium]